MSVLAEALVALATAAPSADTAYAFARSIAREARPAASAAERRAHAKVEQRFEAAGLRVGHDRFRVPGRGRSRNVVGIRDADGDCLHVLMAHIDSVPPARGAVDNASGVGALVALAEATTAPRCDTWFVATGAEERPYTRQADHLGAAALVRRIRRLRRTQDVRWALSLDMVGRGRSLWVRSKARRPRKGVERPLVRAGARFVRETGDQLSDHRELARAGMPAMWLGLAGDDPCRHAACDGPGRLQRPALRRTLRVVSELLG